MTLQYDSAGRDLSPILRLLWFAAGAEGWILEAPESRVDRNRCATYGAFVLLNTVLAAGLWGFASWSGFRSAVAAVVGAVLGGALVFSIDRFLVKSIEKHPSRPMTAGAMVLGGLRIAVAGLIAYLIAIPFVMQVSADEIRAELDARTQAAGDSLRAAIGASYQSTVNRLETEIADARRRADGAVAAAARQDAEVQAEADGTGGSRQRAIGPITELKQDIARRLHEQARELVRAADSVAAANRPQLAAIDSLQRAEVARRLVQRAPRGLVAQHNALKALERRPEGRAVFWLDLLLTGILLLFDCIPVLAKLMTPAGPYEARLIGERRRAIKRAEDRMSQAEFRDVARYTTLVRAGTDVEEATADAMRTLRARFLPTDLDAASPAAAGGAAAVGPGEQHPVIESAHHERFRRLLIRLLHLRIADLEDVLLAQDAAPPTPARAPRGLRQRRKAAAPKYPAAVAATTPHLHGTSISMNGGAPWTS